MRISFTKRQVLKYICLIPIAAGVFLLLQVILPIIQYQFWEAQTLKENALLVSPLTMTQKDGTSDSNDLGITVSQDQNFPSFISSAHRDVTYHEFMVSLPRLKMNNLYVNVESNDFESNAAQLPGTALPGEKGNVFISGHSALPLINGRTKINPVFSQLPYAKKGDQIEVKVGDQQYIYQVLGIEVVDPKEVRVINPPEPTGRYLTLMTCVPPGLNSKRLIVLSQLVE